MADSSSKLIFQGSLSLSYSPQSNNSTPSRKKKSALNSTSSYSVLYLDGRLECYPGDPFSVGSPHEACKPIHTLHFNVFNHWSLISIPSKSSLPFPFTVSRKLPPPASPTRSPAHLTHLGLDVETMGSPPSPAENNKSKDRKSLKQRIGFGSKRTTNKKNSEQSHSSTNYPPSPSSEDTSLRSPPPKSSSFIATLGSPGSAPSVHSSFNLIDLPNSITFSTHSESSRKQWIDAFIKVFRSGSDLELSSANFASILQAPQAHSPISLSTPRSANSDSGLHSHLNFLNPSYHSSRIPLAPLPSQSAHPPSKPIPETPSQQLYPSVSQTTSPADPYTLKARASPTLPFTSSHVVTVTPARSPNKKPPSGTPSLTEHIPTSSSPSDYCLSPPPLSCPTSLGMNGNSQVKIAEVVPAWIKAVRNADDKRDEQDPEFNQSEADRQVSPETGISSKLQSPFEIISRDNSIDQSHSRQTSQGPSSYSMSHSFSAPGPLSNAIDQPSRHVQENSKLFPATSIKSFGTSVAQNLKRAGSLTDWPDFSNAGQSILQRMRENDNQSVLSDGPMSSSPIVTYDPVECSDLNSARTKRAWLLQMVKKSGSAEKPKGAFNSHSSASLLASTSAARPPSRAARHGVYMLKGLSSNSSLASSSHQVVASSRESDGHHSLHQVLTPGTDSDQGHRSYHSAQTLPQLPNKSSQSTQRFPAGQSKQAFSEWLTTTSSQAALRLGQSSKTEFGPTHTKSRSLASSPWSHLPSHSSSGSNGISLLKSNPKLNSSRELGLKILSSEGGLSRSGYHGRLSSETSSSYGQEDLGPAGHRSSSSSISDRSQSPENLVQGAEHFEQATTFPKLCGSYVRDSERSSDFLPSEHTNNESSQGRVHHSTPSDKHSIEPEHGNQTLINSRILLTEKNIVNNLDSSSKENSFEFLSSEPQTSSNWSNNEKSNKVPTRGRTHTIGTLHGGPHKGHEMNNGTIPLPSLPVPPGRRKNNKSLTNTTFVATQVKKDGQNLASEENHAHDHLYRPLKESRLKFNTSGDENNRSSRLKTNGCRSITTGIEGEFGK